MFQALTSSLLTQTDTSVGSLPLATHILAVLGLGCGLVLWLVGQRVLKPVSGLLGGIFGGLIGFMVVPQLAPDTLMGIPSPYAGLAIGGLFGLGAGLMMFRFALAISTAIALGLAGTLIGAAAIRFQPMQDATRNLGTLKSEAAQAAGGPVTPNVNGVIAASKPVAQVVKDFAQKRTEEVRGAWNALTPRDQMLLALSGVGGLAAGFFFGLFFPKKSGAIATSLFGSAVWLPSTVWIINALEVPGRQHLDRSSVFWLITWGVVALVGVIVQVNGESREAPKAKD